MKLIVHIGAHKTATTHLQMRLQAAGDDLRARGAAFCGPATTRGTRIALSTLLAHPGRWPDAEADWSAYLGEQAGIGRLVLSEENLLGGMVPGELTDADGRLYPQAGPRLQRLFCLAGRGPTSIALAVREPSSFITSAFGMWMLGGSGVLIDEFLDGVDPRAISWAEFGVRLLAETGTPRLSVWRFEDYPRDRDKVLARLIGPGRVPVVKGQPRALVGWSQQAYDAFVTDVLAAREGDDLATLARAARNNHPRTGDTPGMAVLPPGLVAETQAAYAADFARLAAIDGVRPVV